MKKQITFISKKIKRSIGILSKFRYNYVDSNILVNLYYALIYPFITYGLIIWGNVYSSTVKPLIILQKKVVRIITFSKFDAHSSSLFKQLNIIKLTDLVNLHVVLFMYKYHNNLLPPTFDNFFTPVCNVHSQNTRLASKLTYYQKQEQISVFSISDIKALKYGILYMNHIKTCRFLKLNINLESIFLESIDSFSNFFYTLSGVMQDSFLDLLKFI